MPSSFNKSSEVYTDSDASFFAFYKKNLYPNVGERALHTVRKVYATNIRGFEGAKWVGKVDWEVDTGGTIQILQSPPSKPLDSPEWGNVAWLFSKTKLGKW